MVKGNIAAGKDQKKKRKKNDWVAMMKNKVA